MRESTKPKRLEELDLATLPPGRRVRAWLALVGWTTLDLAAEVEADPADVRRVLRGDDRRLSARIRARVAEVTGVEVPFEG